MKAAVSKDDSDDCADPDVESPLRGLIDLLSWMGEQESPYRESMAYEVCIEAHDLAGPSVESKHFVG